MEVKNIPEHTSAQSLHPLWLMAGCVIPIIGFFFFLGGAFFSSIPSAISWEYVNFTFQLRRSHSKEVRRGLMRNYLNVFSAFYCCTKLKGNMVWSLCSAELISLISATVNSNAESWILREECSFLTMAHELLSDSVGTFSYSKKHKVSKLCGM